MSDDETNAAAPSTGTIIRAENGDILRFDETGMVMVLSDRVIADIARRLPEPEAAQGLDWIDPEVLGDIDAWDLRVHGEWHVFSANLAGRQGPRQFRRLIRPDTDDSDPAIIADASGPVRGIVSLGGSRRATGFPGQPDFPWHVLSPADEIGAVGLAGTDTAKPQRALQPLPEMTRDAALADVLLTRQFDAHRALCLHMVRCESDSAASIAELADGSAYRNLKTALATLRAAADRLDKRAGLLAIGLDFVLEDVKSDPLTYQAGVRHLLHKLRADLAALSLRCPPFLSVFDCGTQQINDHPLLRAQWDLAWQGHHDGLHYTAPGYMFRQDRFARPDMQAVWQMAEMDAAALEQLLDDAPWFCPVFLLAEREPDAPHVIRARARAMGPLEIDPSDPFGAGPGAGFSLEGQSNEARLVSVAVAEDDPQDICLTFDAPPEGDALHLLYAFGQTPERSGIDYPQACGAVRDGWSRKSRTGTTLHRWALPAAIPVH